MAKTIKVLHILGELRPSGMEVMLRNSAHHWFSKGLKVDVLSTGDVEGVFAPELESAGYQVFHIPFSKSIGFFWSVFKLIREEDYDVVHVHTERANFYLSLLAWLSGRRRVVRTVHSVFKYSGGKRYIRVLQRWLLRRLGISFVSVSSSVSANERTRLRNPTMVINNWIDVTAFTPPSPEQREEIRSAFKISAETFVIGTVGNCSPVKNHALLINALAELKRNIDWLYLHVGCEDKAKQERQLAKELGISEKIHFLGCQSEVWRYLQACDVFVMPSLVEGLSIACAEALATGLPALINDVPGLWDFSGFPGVRFFNGDVASLVESLQLVYEMPQEERMNFGLMNAQMARERFNPSGPVQQYVALYLKCL